MQRKYTRKVVLLFVLIFVCPLLAFQFYSSVRTADMNKPLITKLLRYAASSPLVPQSKGRVSPIVSSGSKTNQSRFIATQNENIGSNRKLSNHYQSSQSRSMANQKVGVIKLYQQRYRNRNNTQSNQTRDIVTHREIKEMEEALGRPFTLPPGVFKPKQSLGQNFLSDQNYVRKIVSCMSDDSEKGSRVVEIGPGLGALTRVLFPKYPKMRAIELDERSVKFLNEKMPDLEVIHMNALDADWAQLAADRKGRLNVIGNLPYNVVSQILFDLVDHNKAINTAVFTMQLELAERMVARPGNKDYGIPSVCLQLYSKPTMNFKIPPSVFYPVPKVDSALITFDFTSPDPALDLVDLRQFRRVVSLAFNQRRKMLRQSLKDVTNAQGISLSERWDTKRPDQLTPLDFIQLTIDIYGELKHTKSSKKMNSELVNSNKKINDPGSRDTYASNIIWRRSVNVKSLGLETENDSKDD